MLHIEISLLSLRKQLYKVFCQKYETTNLWQKSLSYKLEANTDYPKLITGSNVVDDWCVVWKMLHCGNCRIQLLWNLGQEISDKLSLTKSHDILASAALILSSVFLIHFLEVQTKLLEYPIMWGTQ